MRSVQTTIAGWVAGLGAMLVAIAEMSPEPTVVFGNVTLASIGAGLTALAVTWGFTKARDDNVTSEGTKIKR